MTTFLAARPRSYRASAPFVLAALLAGTHAHAQDATGGVDAIFSAFDPAEPGCAAAVARDGRVVVNRAFGLAHLEHAVPNTPATIFDVASVNKQFTAAAVLMLAEEGRLSLQDDIRRYLPEMPDYGTPITIDHVLTQTSGLRDWLFLSMIAGHHPFKSPRMYQAADVLDLAARQRGLNHAPGAEFSYTNTGYHLLTIIVERVSGRSLQDFTSERIFQPLGMTSTRWRADIREVIPGRATSYEREDGRWMHGMPLFDNLFTTTGDLLRWNDALAENRLGPRITQELQRQGRLNDGSPIEFAPGMAYTRGLTIGEHRGAQEIAHGGSSAGYRSYVSRYPAHRLSVAVLCNSGEANATRIARVVRAARSDVRR
ncbi:MAG: beta-lactamase family protein, partial [Gemmatimonadetes bacterium]|nr:beta-lactamase family protein [Gemmatimonadota bacterium]